MSHPFADCNQDDIDRVCIDVAETVCLNPRLDNRTKLAGILASAAALVSCDARPVELLSIALAEFQWIGAEAILIAIEDAAP